MIDSVVDDPSEIPAVDLYAQWQDDVLDLEMKHRVTPDRLPEVIDFYLTRTPNKPPMPVALWGATGLGKTSGVRQYAGQKNYRLVVLHLQLFDPTDLKGIAVRMDDGVAGRPPTVKWVTTGYFPQQRDVVFKINETGSTLVDFDIPNAEFLEFQFFTADGLLNDDRLSEMVDVDVIDPRKQIRITPKNADVASYTNGSAMVRVMERAIIFLDEISTANPEVQNAALSFVWDGRINEYTVPSSCRFIAAGNTEDDGAFVNEISSALAGRFLHIVMTATVGSFLTYAMERKYDPLVISFLSLYGATYLHRYNGDKMRGGRYGFASPRGWENHCLQTDPTASPWLQNITTIGLLGPETGHRFIGFKNLAIKLPSPTKILAGEPYRWDKLADRGTALMMSSLLVTHLNEVFFDLKSAIHGVRLEELRINYDKHPKRWLVACDEIFRFMNDHLQPDARISTYFMIVKIAQIPPRILSGSEFEKFSNKDIETIKAINAMKTG